MVIITEDEARAYVGQDASYQAGTRDETVLQALSDAGGRSTFESLAVDIGWNGGAPSIQPPMLVCLVEGYVRSLPGGLWEITTAGENALA